MLSNGFFNRNTSRQALLRSWVPLIVLAMPLKLFAGQLISAPSGAMPLGQLPIADQVGAISGNPAACHQVLSKSDRFRMSYWGSTGLYAELGDLKNFEDEVDALVDILDDTTRVDANEADDVRNRFNALLVELGESGYMKTNIDVGLPLLPMAFHHEVLKGNLCLNAGVRAQFKGSVLDDELTVSVPDNNFTVEFDSNSSLFLKSAVLKEFGLSYSRKIFHSDHIKFPGEMIFGTRLNFYSMELSRQVILFESFDNDDVGDVISDEYDQNQVTSSSIGLDVGALWRADKYQLGLTIANINEPDFDFGDLGINCNTLTTNAQQLNCAAAQSFVASGDITQQDTHTMESLMIMDAAYYIKPNWVLGVSYDLADYTDPAGDDLQYFNIGTRYYPSSRWIPAWRLGYRSNQVGQELSSVQMGTTLFGVFNFDVLYGLDDTEVDDDSIPRNLGVSFGFQQML